MEAHMHDDRYMTKAQLTLGQMDARTGAVRMTFGQQRRWYIQGGFALVLPICDIDNGADLSIEDGAELTLVG